MAKVYVEFDSLEEAVRVCGGGVPTSAPQILPTPQAYAPAPAAPVYAPAPLPQAPVYAAAPAPAAPVYAAPATPGLPPMGGAPAMPTGTLTSAQVAAQAQVFSKANGAKAAKEVLASFGVKAISELDPGHYPALMQKLGG